MIKLGIFDIDGTLLRAGKAPRKAFKEAITRVYKVKTNIENFSFVGKTDLSIIHEILLTNGVKKEKIKKGLRQFFEEYSRLLEKYMKSEKEKKVLPGVKELLNMLRDEGVLLTLLTGNIKKGAMIKLKSLGLWNYFKTGAFGNEAMERKKLLGILLKKVEKLQDIKREDTILFGDSIPDIECGRYYGIKTLIVGTGWTPKAEILKAKPDLFVDDFSAPHKVIELIKS